MWTTALLVIVPTALFVGIVVVLHHYFAPEGGWLRSMEDAGEIFSTVGTGLAVLIAFLIVAAFGHYQSARDAVGKEAVAIQQQYVMASYFDEADNESSAQVCVLGEQAKVGLLGYEPAVGKFVRVNDTWLKVVGVLKEQLMARAQNTAGSMPDANNVIFIPSVSFHWN